MSCGGDLYILSAPSGAGKSTLIRRVFADHSDIAEGLAFCVSHTTRPARSGEIHGRDYYFVDAEEFGVMTEAGEFLEWAQVHGHLKGTSRSEVARLRSQGLDVLLEIDVQGAAQVRTLQPDAVSIFILPPSYPELEARLRGRGSDSEAQIERRLSDARFEIRGAGDYDYVIVNRDLIPACRALASTLRARRFQRNRMQAEIDRVLGTLPA